MASALLIIAWHPALSRQPGVAKSITLPSVAGGKNDNANQVSATKVKRVRCKLLPEEKAVLALKCVEKQTEYSDLVASAKNSLLASAREAAKRWPKHKSDYVRKYPCYQTWDENC